MRTKKVKRSRSINVSKKVQRLIKSKRNQMILSIKNSKRSGLKRSSNKRSGLKRSSSKRSGLKRSSNKRSSNMKKGGKRSGLSERSGLSKRSGGERSGPKKKNVVVKSLPNKDDEKLEDVMSMCDKSVIKFYMNGCPHCVNMQSAWEDLCNSGEIQNYCDETGCTIGMIEVESNSITDAQSKKYGIQGFPHIILVDKNGNVKEVFGKERTSENLVSFAKTK
jgi:glutaredoxin